MSSHKFCKFTHVIVSNRSINGCLLDWYVDYCDRLQTHVFFSCLSSTIAFGSRTMSIWCVWRMCGISSYPGPQICILLYILIYSLVYILKWIIVNCFIKFWYCNLIWTCVKVVHYIGVTENMFFYDTRPRSVRIKNNESFGVFFFFNLISLHNDEKCYRKFQLALFTVTTFL